MIIQVVLIGQLCVDYIKRRMDMLINIEPKEIFEANVWA